MCVVVVVRAIRNKKKANYNKLLFQFDTARALLFLNVYRFNILENRARA